MSRDQRRDEGAGTHRGCRAGGQCAKSGVNGNRIKPSRFRPAEHYFLPQEPPRRLPQDQRVLNTQDEKAAEEGAPATKLKDEVSITPPIPPASASQCQLQTQSLPLLIRLVRLCAVLQFAGPVG